MFSQYSILFCYNPYTGPTWSEENKLFLFHEEKSPKKTLKIKYSHLTFLEGPDASTPRAINKAIT